MKRKFAIVLLICIGVLMVLPFVSCGARKTHKSEVKEEVRKDSVGKTKEVVISVSKQTDSLDIVCDDFIIEPIDSIAPMVITDFSGKTTIYKNARLKREVKTDKSVLVKTEKVSALRDTEVSKSVVSIKESAEKSTERESAFAWWWLIVPAVIIVGAIYFCIRYKNVVVEAEELI